MARTLPFALHNYKSYKRYKPPVDFGTLLHLGGRVIIMGSCQASKSTLTSPVVYADGEYHSLVLQA